MGFLDFLFEGKPPKSVTTYGQTVQNVPAWLSDYTQGLIARSNAIAAEPYQPYTGPRVAGFTPDQTGAFDLTRGTVGTAQPWLGQALTGTQQAMSPGAINQALMYLPEAADLARGSLTQGGLSAAMPYINRADRTFPGAVDEYMDPYVGKVIDRAKMEAGRFWDEKLMPSINDTFIGSGQFGSTRHHEIAQRGARDVTEGLQSQAEEALSRGYGMAGQLFGADQSRLGALAGLTGELGGQQQGAMLQAGQQLGALGQLTGNLGIASGELGLRGSAQLGALGEALQSLGLRDAAALEAIGRQQQGLNQRNLDTAYGDFIEQRDFPMRRLDWLSTIIRGLPPNSIPTATTSSGTGPSSVYQPSPLAQVASLATGIKGLYELGQGD